MKTTLLPPAWRKTLLPMLSPSPVPARSRRTLRLESLLVGDLRSTAKPDDEDDGGSFDGSWHESSRALACGLVVREWGDTRRDLAALTVR